MSITDPFTSDRVPFGTGQDTNRRRALGDAVLLLVASAIAVLLVPKAFQLFLTGPGYHDDVVTFVVGGSIATLLVGVVAVVYLDSVHQVTIPVRQPSLREWGWVAVGAILSIFLLLLTGVVLAQVGATGGEPVTAELELPPWAFVYAIIWSLVAIGPLEELLFRGVVQGRLREAFGAVAAIGITAVGFGIAHAPSYVLVGANPLSPGVLIAVTAFALAAVIYGAIYEWTANLTVVAVAHGLTDAFVYAIVLVALI